MVGLGKMPGRVLPEAGVNCGQVLVKIVPESILFAGSYANQLLSSIAITSNALSPVFSGKCSKASKYIT